MFRLIQRTFTSKHSKETLESLTYYEILNVRPDSTKEQIRKNYLKLARKFHPDLQIEPNLEFSYIAQAYQTLMNDTAKAEYDDGLVNDTEFYSVKVGAFSLKLKYLFMGSLGLFFFALAVSEYTEDDEGNSCPNSCKIKKVGMGEAELIVEQEMPNNMWTRVKKTGSAPGLLQVKLKEKGVFTGKIPETHKITAKKID